jgi:hypothetical protein
MDRGTTPWMGEVDRVGNTRSRATQGAVADDCMDAGGRATQGAVAEQTANSQIMADCLSANPPFELKTWRVFDREGIVVNPILNRIEPSQSKCHIKTKNRPAGNGLAVWGSVAPMSHDSATLH